MSENSELRNIQLEELKILKTFAELCDRHQLTYYISGGTYLGSVRHKGFIPWDDDVDVAMPRRDFLEFLRLAKTELPEEYSINDFRCRKGSMYYVPKIESEAYQLVSRIARKEKVVNLWIDVFPLDGLPENKLLKQLHKAHLLILRGLYKLAYFDELVDYQNKKRPWYENAVISLALKINLSKWISGEKVMGKLDRVLSRYDFYESKEIMNFMGSYKFRSIMNREKIYAEGALYEFEGSCFHGPKDYDTYLKQIYGNYMELPPLEKRNWHQTAVLRKKEK